ncbi:hypothetical protein ZIOFF_009863 [Zingiber officinale]|uniref:ZF-HD dimerization-type domain-containing protein n=1 Tax=Zingiber officinale TaxID=94328 RepID=A0A8J5HYM7_ZINOF|nr:hypothetical protein ZIOFF_009863 [Zingiber officinale]
MSTGLPPLGLPKMSNFALQLDHAHPSISTTYTCTMMVLRREAPPFVSVDLRRVAPPFDSARPILPTQPPPHGRREASPIRHLLFIWLNPTDPMKQLVDIAGSDCRGGGDRLAVGPSSSCNDNSLVSSSRGEDKNMGGGGESAAATIAMVVGGITTSQQKRGGEGGRYRECLKNHALGIGGQTVDGCGEFMAAGEEGTLDELRCAACGCHRNFHRKGTRRSRNHYIRFNGDGDGAPSPTLALLQDTDWVHSSPPPLRNRNAAATAGAALHVWRRRCARRAGGCIESSYAWHGGVRVGLQVDEEEISDQIHTGAEGQNVGLGGARGVADPEAQRADCAGVLQGHRHPASRSQGLDAQQQEHPRKRGVSVNDRTDDTSLEGAGRSRQLPARGRSQKGRRARRSRARGHGPRRTGQQRQSRCSREGGRGGEVREIPRQGSRRPRLTPRRKGEAEVAKGLASVCRRSFLVARLSSRSKGVWRRRRWWRRSMKARDQGT